MGIAISSVVLSTGTIKHFNRIDRITNATVQIVNFAHVRQFVPDGFSLQASFLCLGHLA